MYFINLTKSKTPVRATTGVLDSDLYEKLLCLRKTVFLGQYQNISVYEGFISRTKYGTPCPQVVFIITLNM